MSAPGAAVTRAHSVPPKVSAAGSKSGLLHHQEVEVHRSWGSEVPFVAGDLILGVALSFRKFCVIFSKRCFVQVGSSGSWMCMKRLSGSP